MEQKIIKEAIKTLGLDTDFSIDMQYWQDALGNIIHVSKSCERITGYTPEEFMANPKLFESIVIPEDVSKWNAHSELSKADVLHEAQFRILHKEKRIVWIDHISQKVYDEKGRFSGFRGLNRDITQKKTISDIYKTSPTVFFLWKNEEGWPVEFVSKNIETLSGYSKQEFLSRKISYINIISEEDVKRVEEEVKYFSSKDIGEFRHKPYRIITIDGKIKWVDDRTHIRRDVKKNITHYQGSVTDITDRKEAEELLEAEKCFSEKIIETSSAIIVGLDKDHKIRIFNSGAERIIKYKKEEVLGKDWFEMFSTPSVLEKKDKLWKEVWGVASLSYINTIINKDGEERIISWQSTGLYDNKDKSKHLFISIGSDITKQKRAEADFLKLYRATEQSPVSVIITNQNGDIEYVNKKFTETTGYLFEDVLGKNPRILNSGNHSKEFYEELWDTVLAGKNWKGKFENRKKNGELFWESAIISPLVNDNGDITNFVSVKEDITKIREKETDLKESEERYMITADIVGDVYYRLNYKNMKYEFIHPNIEKLTGYKADELRLRDIIIEIKKGNNNFDINEIEEERKKTESAAIYSDYLILMKDDKKKWISDRSYPWVDKNGVVKGCQGVLSDISARKKMEKHLSIAKENAEKADKMKSIFLAQMSHEIRTPINALVSMASLLKSDFEETADDDQMVGFDIIESSGKRIIRTVDLLLNLSEIQAGTYERTPTLVNLFSEILSPIIASNKKVAAKKGIKLSLTSLVGDFSMVIDSYTVNQIFIQIIENAIKYTNKGFVEVKVLNNFENHLVVEVKDSGIGIEGKYLKNIFKPFSQEEMGYTRKYEGNGIGLALAKTYCEINNALIEVESEKNVGSTFRVIFL